MYRCVSSCFKFAKEPATADTQEAKVRTAPDSIMLVTDSIIPANVLSPGHKKDGI